MHLPKKDLTDISGIGVDVVSTHRMRAFLSRHRDQVRDRIFSSSENKQITRISAKKLAESFAAKEAFFKATPESWLGPQGFSRMHLKRLTPTKFHMTWKDASLKRSYQGVGVFSYKDDHVIARVVVTK